MNKFSSATAGSQNVLRLPPPSIVADPRAMERWYFSLTPLERGTFRNFIILLIQKLPMAQQEKIRRRYEAISSTSFSDLGFWAAAAPVIAQVSSAAVQAGASIYTSREQADLAERLQGRRSTTQLQTTALREAFAAEVAQAQTEAMQSAAETAGQAQVLTAQQAAHAAIAKTQVVTGALKPVIIGAVVIGGLGAFMMIRKKKKR